MTTQTRSVVFRSSVLAASTLFTGACSNGYYSCVESRTCVPAKETADASGNPVSTPDSAPAAGGAPNAKGGAGGNGAGGSLALGASGGAVGASVSASGGDTGTVNDAGVDAPNTDSDAGASPRDDGGAVKEPDAEAPVKDPCVACDVHARCTPTATAAPCQCIQGYQGDGHTCARDLCQPLEGEGPPCGANATCTTSAAARVCACTAGFASCDGPSDPAKGCEAKPATEPKNCGQCGFSCAGSLGCTNGTCNQAATKLGLGFYASFALAPESLGSIESKVYGWGSNARGTLPTANTSGVVTEPSWFTTPGAARDLAASTAHACVLSAASDTVQCWGQNTAYDLGTTASVSAGTVVSTLVAGAAEVALGNSSTCVRAQTGKVSCWGLGSELGTAAATSSATPVDVPGVTDARRLFGGFAGHCALRADDTVSCWGAAPFSQSPTTLLNADGTPVKDATSVAIAKSSYCISRKSGAVACAGTNGFGELGQGTTDGSTNSVLVAVPGLTGVAEVSGHYFHFCARTSAGSLYCWGFSEFGALGLGANIGTIPAGGTSHVLPTPTLVPGLSGVVDAVAGFVDTCVRLSTGQVACFGRNADATLGDGTQIQRMSAVDVVGLP